MATTIRGFRVELYLEHLEEASFLYEQKVSLPADPEIQWRDLRDFEERLEAHLDALVVGGDLAGEVCRERAQEGDAGEVHAAVRTFCRGDRRADVEALFASCDLDDDAVAIAVRDALRWELPSSWEPWLVSLCQRTDGVGLIAFEVLTYRRCTLEHDVATLAAAFASTARGLTALGRLEPASSSRLPWERRGLPTETHARRAFALATLRAGLPFDRLPAPSGDEGPLPRCLGEGAHRVADLLRTVDTTDDPDVLLALGLLGDPVAVEPLIANLAREDVADAAAVALHAITGTMLLEQTWIPDEDDEEDPGEASDDSSRGESVLRPSTDRDAWSAWWRDHENAFVRGVPHRLGEPYSPHALWRTLTEDHVTHELRSWAIEELTIRYGFDPGLEVDQDVQEQERRLERLKRWADGEGSNLPRGVWTYHGRDVAS
ncbi:MAG: hypothetical protein H6834_05660 [Planctomycetes bacterium]|nr:hypothetical protein [Planctomycetota bacterium]MCB9890879.1 hypothetical protein [Planctomycetota bacterium]